MRTFGMLAALGALLVGVAAPAAAQDRSPKPLEFTVTVTGQAGIVRGSPSDHFLSFSGPIEIPGVGLKPGTYIFQPVGPSLVRVMSEDRSTVYSTFFTTPVTRYAANENQSEVTFERSAPGAPVRIAAWFQPGQDTGVAPLYPRQLPDLEATGN